MGPRNAPIHQNELFLKFMSALVTAAAIKMAMDIGEIKTTVALAVQRIEQMEARIRVVEGEFRLPNGGK